MKYTESIEASARYKQDYATGIERLISNREKAAADIRRAYFSDICKDREKYRKDFADMLGWPLNERGGEATPKVVSEKLSDEDGYTISRLSIEVLDGLMLTGLYFEYSDGRQRPLVVVQHGGSGTPELISGVNGSTFNYNNMLKRVFDRNVNVFAPQLLLWDAGKYEVAYDRHEVDSRLKRVGGSVAALEVYGIMRALDYFTSLSVIGNVGMVGMSYGGFYTLMTTAADERIKAAYSCSFFCDGSVFVKPDLCWKYELCRFGQAEIAALVYPRRLFLQMGDSDELFDSKKSKVEFDRIKELVGDDSWVKFSSYGGKHEFCKDDAYIDELTDILKHE